MELNLLNQEEITALHNLLSNATDIVVCAHKSPDGGATGSSLTWMYYLNQIGKINIKVCIPNVIPDFLHWLPGYNSVIRHDRRPKEVKKAFKETDLVCCLDFNQNSRVDAMQEVLESSTAPHLLIGHYLEPETSNTLAVSHPEVSSTCEIVFCLISRLDGCEKITTQCVSCVYCGMMTDTGGFVYSSSRPEIFYIIGQLLTKSIDKDEIYNRASHNYSTSALRLRAHIIPNKIKMIEELHASYYTVTKKEMAQFHFIKGDMEGLVNIPQQIKRLKLSISLREDTERPKTVFASLHSCNGFHCQPMATKFFNGDGHADALSGRLSYTIKEAEQIAIKVILYYREELQ